MDNNFLYVYGNENNNKFVVHVLEGIEEQGIRYKLLPLDNYKEINLGKIPFNVAVQINDKYVELKSMDFKNNIRFKVKIENKKIAKEFGLDVGRYIKRIPLKGDWYE